MTLASLASIIFLMIFQRFLNILTVAHLNILEINIVCLSCEKRTPLICMRLHALEQCYHIDLKDHIRFCLPKY